MFYQSIRTLPPNMAIMVFLDCRHISTAQLSEAMARCGLDVYMYISDTALGRCLSFPSSPLIFTPKPFVLSVPVSIDLSIPQIGSFPLPPCI